MCCSRGLESSEAALASEVKFSFISHTIINNAEALHTLGLCKYPKRLFRKNEIRCQFKYGHKGNEAVISVKVFGDQRDLYDFS